MTKRMLIMLACVGLLFGGIFGYKAIKAHMVEKAMSAHQGQPVTVSTTKAEKQTWQPQLNAVGTVRAEQGVEVTTEIAGLVRDVYFSSGENVDEGQVLVQLNADADEALLNSLKAEAELARTTFVRDQRQFAVKAISRATLDVSEADLKSKQAQVNQQTAIVDKKTIRAPFDGRLGISTVTAGQYLNPGDQIVTLQSIDPVYVDFSVPQQYIARIALGQTVTVATDTYPDRKFDGKITATNPKVDPQTRNIQIEATIPNPKHELLPGMFTSVQVQAGQTEHYITLPKTAVTYNPYGETVFVVEQAAQGPKGEPELIAKQTFVTVGRSRGDQVAILEGVKSGDSVVTSGQLKLKNGSRVTINNEIQPSNEAAPQPTDP
ncbi:MAG: efflux RND transporter periplasmic adaptor subunit [Desulfobacterales bacterium]|jgi:membrane fusion protein (multidrug efflux system)